MLLACDVSVPKSKAFLGVSLNTLIFWVLELTLVFGLILSLKATKSLSKFPILSSHCVLSLCLKRSTVSKPISLK